MDIQLELFFRHIIPFTESELQDVEAFFKPRHLKKNEHFVQVGDMVNEILFIKKGSFRVYYLVDGKESTRFLGLENIFVTSLPAFTSRKPSIEYVQALEDSDVLVTTFQDLQKMYELSPKWERMVRLMVEGAFYDLQNRVYSLISETAHTRYERIKNERPQLLQRIPQYIIANYLGISPETLSRLRKIS